MMALLEKLERRWRRLTLGRSFALNELDWKLRRYLDYQGGVFVEAGANNGLDQTNSLHFERYRNWTGLLVEPIPSLAELCRQNRPGCRVENCALVPFDFLGETIEMEFCNLMSLVKGAMQSFEREQAHISAGAAVQGIQPYSITVPARTLSSVLEMHEIRDIDLLSLDVEGFESNVLKGLDFEKHRPKFMLIEARFRQEIEEIICPMYAPTAQLSEHDVLYKRQ
jgi:FkbM family methyltransferase